MSLFSWIKNLLKMEFVAVDLTEFSSLTVPPFGEKNYFLSDLQLNSTLTA